MHIMKSTLFLPATLVLGFVLTGCQTAEPDRFAKNDTNHDGHLSRDEVNHYVVSAVFDSRDANGDRKMSREEWGAGDDAGHMRIFHDRDANRDGMVTFDEALAYGRKKGIANQVMRAADTNKDGALTREEINSYYASREGNPR